MFMRKSLFWKYIKTIVIILLIGFVLFGAMVMTYTISTTEESKETMLRSNAKTITALFQRELDDTWSGSSLYFDLWGNPKVASGATVNIANVMANNEDLTDMLKLISNNGNTDLLVVDDKGNSVFFCTKVLFIQSSVLNYGAEVINNVKINQDTINKIETEGNKNGLELKTSIREIAKDIDNDSENKISEVTSEYINTDRHIVAKPVKMTGNTDTLGYIFVMTDASEITQMSLNIVKGMIIAAALVLLLIFAIVALWTYRMVKPLHQMALATKSFARGDFSKRVDVDSEDEVGQLSLSFNQMADSLASSESVRRSFVANVSHELKTPMTTIAGFIDGILDGTIPHERESHYLEIVSSEVRRLSRLVESMLSLSRIDSGEIKLRQESFNISATIFNTILTFEDTIESKGIEIRGLDSIPEINLIGDPDMIHQVVYNLVENAVKFVNNDGFIEIKAFDASDKCIVKITNSGRGIEPDELKHVFEKFYKTDKSRSIDKKGMGLGLYIVKTIIRLHGGDINVSSVVDESTTFEFYIPKKDDKSKKRLGSGSQQ